LYADDTNILVVDEEALQYKITFAMEQLEL
jgi:hypothetical protein